MKWGDYPRLSSWAQCNHQCPNKRETGESELEKGIWGTMECHAVNKIFLKAPSMIWGKDSWANKEYTTKYTVNLIVYVCVFTSQHAHSV